jgi:drug/metabolite transporter (DMT)-like permease
MGEESGISLGFGWIALAVFLAAAGVVVITRNSRSTTEVRATLAALSAVLLAVVCVFALVYPSLWRAGVAVDHPLLYYPGSPRVSLAVGWYIAFACTAAIAGTVALPGAWRPAR